ncbi:F0F1 ATP synthase subunit delta [Pseudogracilibacillus auburnensis]|uniref:ATP synthase subunit delta n=1 Tax=Pseudogracilibacillus auburnensis TaxID=1494959 RepID=A0A2V3VLF2_9BACI|nr:F0F1 ATP synthase subunit delta [Pseudogracilibacillus auburnensis]PXW82380.1 ATP synthase F1 subcomplex delta subunit [Pseudogracilibacillus auburnensis]
MSEAVVAKRYADALFQLANEKNNVVKLISELEVVKEVFLNDKKMIDVLNHPRISNHDKMNIINGAFGQFDKDVINTLKILVERHRINVITSIVDHFVHLYNEANGVAAATVYSVRALSDEEKANLESSFKKQFNKQSVSIKNVVDPTLIGGMRIRVGNTIYDGSISGKLNRIKHNIVSASI